MSITITQLTRSLSIVAVLVAMSGCSDRASAGLDTSEPSNPATTSNIDPKAIELLIQPAHVTVFAGESTQLVARLTVDDGSVDDTDCQWSSRDPAVASVRAGGTVKGEGVGTTTVTATCAGLSADATVEVNEAPTPHVEIIEEAITLALPHQRVDVDVDAQSASGVELTARELTWTSTDESIVKAEEGVIWPVAPGEAVVRATFDGAFDDLQVRVLSVTSISIVPPGGTLKLDDDPLQLTLQYVAADGTHLSPEVPVDWRVDDSSRAEIDANAMLHPLAPGPFVVTADSAGQTATAEFVVDVTFTDVTCSIEMCCALDVDGRGYCWGRNPFGSLGVDDEDDVGFPKPLLGGHRFASIHMGMWYACALDYEGAPYCWGWNASGRLGYGTPDAGYPAFGENVQPKRVSSPASFVSLALGGGSTYGLTASGELYVWGVHPVVDDLMPYREPTHPLPSFVDAGPWTRFIGSVNTAYACGLKQDELWCQGTNYYGQLGQGDPAIVGEYFGDFVQYELPTGANIVDVATGQHNMCVLDEFGEVWCSGLNIYGALGLPYEYPYNQDNASHVPRKMNLGRTFDTLIGTRRSMYCGVSKKEVYCWGWNGSCQLGWDPGDDTSNPDHWSSHSHTPVHMDFLPANWTAIALSNSAGCVIDGDGALRCWGLSNVPNDPLGPQLNCDPTLQRVLPYDDE